MATITLKNATNGWSYQLDSGPEQTYYGVPIQITSDAVNSKIKVTVGGSVGGEEYTFSTANDTITIDGVTVTGTHAQKVATLKSTLVFKVANSGSGGSGTDLPTQSGNAGKFLRTNGATAGWASTIEISATKSAVDVSVVPRLIYVTADETNAGDISLYIHNGSTLKFLQTIA